MNILVSVVFSPFKRADKREAVFIPTEPKRRERNIVEEKKFQPYVPADKVMPEFTVVSIVLGAILAIVFGGANAYLGLRVGMTVSASIPAAEGVAHFMRMC